MEDSTESGISEHMQVAFRILSALINYDKLNAKSNTNLLSHHPESQKYKIGLAG